MVEAGDSSLYLTYPVWRMLRFAGDIRSIMLSAGLNPPIWAAGSP